MLTVVYSKYGKSNSDAMSEELALAIYSDKTHYTTSTDSLITAFKLLIAEEKIPYDGIRFVFENEELMINKMGEFENYPKGFCDTEQDMLFRILKSRRRRRKEAAMNSQE